jgi:hypothetical protein
VRSKRLRYNNWLKHSSITLGRSNNKLISRCVGGRLRGGGGGNIKRILIRRCSGNFLDDEKYFKFSFVPRVVVIFFSNTKNKHLRIFVLTKKEAHKIKFVRRTDIPGSKVQLNPFFALSLWASLHVGLNHRSRNYHK